MAEGFKRELGMFRNCHFNAALSAQREKKRGTVIKSVSRSVGQVGSKMAKWSTGRGQSFKINFTLALGDVNFKIDLSIGQLHQHNLLTLGYLGCIQIERQGHFRRGQPHHGGRAAEDCQMSATIKG